ncbi:MAG: PIG-L deacetylase family protein [Acidimicrobiales bacterium]
MTAAQNPLTPAPVHLIGDSRNLPTPERALAIGAHPDDVDFGCGATLAKWAAAGCEVSVLVCTDGSKGTWDPTVNVDTLIATRQSEQRAAAAALGATGDVIFLGSPDGELDSSLVERERVAYWIRMLRPTVVIGHDPWKPYRLHPDHRHAGLLACEGVVAARDHLFFPDQHLPHHRPDLILLFETDNADHAEDVTGFADAKVAALTAHASQFESTMLVRESASGDDSELAEFRAKVEAKLAAAGDAAGVTHAEVFKLIDDL